MFDKKQELPSSTYDDAFLLSEAIEGYEEFKRGDLSFAKQRQFELLSITQGTTILELGYGRGDVLRACAQAGAKVTGIDYSPSALKIAKETLAAYPDADIRLGDCRDLPFASDTFDRVFAADLVEHLSAPNGEALLREMFRVLKPGGFIFLHTTPNTVFRCLYPLVKSLLRGLTPESIEGLDGQFAVMNRVHVREYNPCSLKRLAKLAGLPNPQVWVDQDLLRGARYRLTLDLAAHPLVRFVAGLGKYRLVRFFLGNDIYLRCDKPLSR